MIRAPEMRSPAPRSNAGNRAEVPCNDTFLTSPSSNRKPIRRRSVSAGGVASPWLARASAALSGFGRALG